MGMANMGSLVNISPFLSVTGCRSKPVCNAPGVALMEETHTYRGSHGGSNKFAEQHENNSGSALKYLLKRGFETIKVFTQHKMTQKSLKKIKNTKNCIGTVYPHGLDGKFTPDTEHVDKYGKCQDNLSSLAGWQAGPRNNEDKLKRKVDEKVASLLFVLQTADKTTQTLEEGKVSPLNQCCSELSVQY